VNGRLAGPIWQHAAKPDRLRRMRPRFLMASLLSAASLVAGSAHARAAAPASTIAPAVVAAADATPATPADAVTLPMPWKDGVHAAYASVATQDKLRNGKHVVLTTRETLAISVLEVNPGGVLLRWENQSPVIEASGDGPTLASEKAVVEALATRLGAIPNEVEVNAKGEFTGLRNWQALSGAMREVMLPVLVAQAKARPELAGQDEAALRARFAPLLEKMSGEAATNASLGREAAIFNFFVGASMRRGEPRDYEDRVPSPWSADMLPTRGKFELVAVDDAANTATIHWTQSIDPVRGRDVVRKSMAAAGGKPPAALPATGLPDGVRVDDDATVVLDRSSGLPVRLVHTREVAFGGARTRNTWTLEKKAP
jgi:hypothetical protein